MHPRNEIPPDFVWRRLHSLAGLWLAIYVIFHLLTNAQAALPLGDAGKGFIEEVNWIHQLPFLPLIEIFVLGVPILIHMAWGLKYLRTAEMNSFSSDGRSPYLSYGRNKAYSWQRITSWILLVGVIGHVVHMRFLEYPEIPSKGHYVVKVSPDPALKGLAQPIGFEVLHEVPGEVTVQTDNFGAATLLMVRNTFKSPLWMALYTLFVLTACFHAYNGLWTFMIKWGITLTERSQHLWLRICQGIMVVVAFLGLAAIFGTYWFNLR